MDDVATLPLSNAGQAPLLATKLFVPRLRQNLVSRQHLVDRLNKCLDYPLTLVAAPAGFGKTTLVSTWVRNLSQPVAWLTLDAADNDPVVFLRYLVAALQQIDPAIGQDVRGALEASGPPSIGALIAALINDLSKLPADFVLVLDDFHTIDDAAIHAAIGALVAHQPPQMHLVIATREDPQLPLARLRARGQLVELRAIDLRFTSPEVSIFLKDVMGLALEPSDIQELDARIEGWIAGLQLAALSLQNRENPAELIASLSSSHHFILSYLTEEVLERLTPEIQSFLLETSVLTRLTGPLCDAVTLGEHSATVLEDLYTSNTFVIPLDDEHRWYRYHHLFGDLLRNQLSRTQPGLAPILHARASDWHEKQGAAVDAIESAFAAIDYARVVRLLETHARAVIIQGYAQTVETWLRRLPEEWRAAGPRTNLAFAWSLLLRGQLAEIEPYLHNAEVAAAAGQTNADNAAIHAETLALRAGMVSLHGDTERACALAEEAVTLAPSDDLYILGMARFCLGTAYNYAGRTGQAIATYREALPLCQAAGISVATLLIVANLAVLYTVRGQLHATAELCLQFIEAAERPGNRPSPALAAVYGGYSEVLYAWDELDGADRQAQKWFDLSKRGGHIATIAYGNVMLSRIELARGNSTGAARTLENAIPLIRHGVPAWITAQVTAQQVVLALTTNDTAAAAQALAQTGVGIDDPIHHAREVIHLAYLRLLYHLGRHTPQVSQLEPARDLANRLLASAEPAGRAGRVIETLVLRALVYAVHGDVKSALDDLQRALTLAEPEGYVRVFVNEGEPMARLLRTIHAQGTQAVYVARLLAALPPLPDPDRPAQTGLVEPLSDRELDVLRLIADGLSYEEMAQQLVVSVNTVRFHVKGIYGKLGANKRATALAKAGALGLL